VAKCTAHLGGDDIRAIANVRGGESQQPESRIDHQVLPPVVLDQPVAMVAAVVFDDEAGCRVVEVSLRDESTAAVVEICLNFRAKQAGLEQQPPKPSLHR